jgi:hypothetical protein
VRPLLSLSIGLLVLGVAACGGGDGGGAATEDGRNVPQVPACAKAGRTEAAGTKELPEGFPLPPGTLISSSQQPREGQVLVGGVIPADLQGAAAFFDEELPNAGYQLGLGDSEGNEAEAPFTGNGYRGKWRVNTIPNCNAVTLTLVVIRQD